ncbi:hypothetical protein DAKH74_003140 [Maudiozyma humilis]|uniref:DUF676 domain-containing protein n=1 Tax=Maudiozyma humilis TaxID=51915 RepID=A0AAV5RSM8_MAUHU|nr:hypothetical protein DAKH74_003140 [Kazachstania humilis]
MTVGETFYHEKSALEIGQVERYIITYGLNRRGSSTLSSLALAESMNQSIWLRVKNVSKSTYKASYIMGPFDLYCDVRPDDYEDAQKVVVSAEAPQYKSNLMPQTHFDVQLPLHRVRDQYVWIVDVVSGMIFSTNNHTSYELIVGSTKDSLRSKLDVVDNARFGIQKLTTSDIWKIPMQVQESTKPKHLVVLSHGMHSNVPADMMYLMEQLRKQQKAYSQSYLVVCGLEDNVCLTERGVKFLGLRLAKYILDSQYNDSVTEISFIGHSLGGVVQMFAIAYIAVQHPQFFQKVRPVNFISLASPLLGIAAHNPKYIKYSLSHGVMGETGKDLGLHRGKRYGKKPLLYLLSGEPFQSVLKCFENRTVYANCENDGIVPLYTSGLLYLEYTPILSKLQDMKQKKKEIKKVPKPSIIGSVNSVMTQPKPSKEFIADPTTGDATILHDKVYTAEHCAKLREEYGDTILKPYLKHKVEGEDKSYQQLIADRLHDGVSWRKVVVALPPDAHNNIIVRRRFTNAYGWPVVKHLVSQHFGGDDTPNVTIPQQTFTPLQRLPADQDNEDPYAWLTMPDEQAASSGLLSSTSSMIDRKWHRR